MSSKDRVTIKTYDSTDDAKAAEALLVEMGLPKESVSRSGKKIRVDAQRESEARALIEGTVPSTNGGSGMTDSLAGSTSGAYGTQGETSVTGQVADTASSAATTVADTASSAVDTVVDSAQQVAGAVADSVQGATSAVSGQVATVADTAASGVESLADTVWQSGMQPGAPAVQQQVAQTTANVLDKTAEYLRARDVNLILEDLRSAIRRNPGRTLLLGLGLGYLARGTFFAGGGAQGQGGRMTSPPPMPQPRAVPVYAGETGVGYDAAYNSGMAAPSTLGAGIAPSIGTSTLGTEDIATGDLSESMVSVTDIGTTGDVSTSDIDMLAGTGTAGGFGASGIDTLVDTGTAGSLGASDIDTLAGGTDDTATSLYGSDTGASGDLTASDFGLTSGGASGTDALTSGDQFAVSDLGGSGSGLGGGTSTLDTFGDTGGAGTSTSGDAFGTGSGSSTTGDQSTSTMPDNDLLGQWDAQTRRTDS